MDGPYFWGLVRGPKICETCWPSFYNFTTWPPFTTLSEQQTQNQGLAVVGSEERLAISILWSSFKKNSLRDEAP